MAAQVFECVSRIRCTLDHPLKASKPQNYWAKLGSVLGAFRSRAGRGQAFGRCRSCSVRAGAHRAASPLRGLAHCPCTQSVAIYVRLQLVREPKDSVPVWLFGVSPEGRKPFAAVERSNLFVEIFCTVENSYVNCCYPYYGAVSGVRLHAGYRHTLHVE